MTYGMWPSFPHLPGCSGPAFQRLVGRRDGAALVRCRSCRRVVPVAVLDEPDGEPAEQTEPAEREANVPPEPLVPVASAWRCRDHIDRPVTWRGTGCPECAAEAAAQGRRNARERAERRRARLEQLRDERTQQQQL